ncbi:MAG: hypothetical protein IKX43_04535, partial [Paludibacteraceae bacterium]|nr:hypothetical protein [Paludibacteraceae bacterium]
MKTIKLCQYCRLLAMLVLGTCASLWVDVSAAVIAATDFDAKVYPGDSIPWDLVSVKQEGVSGNTLTSNYTYSGDGKNYRTGATGKIDKVYCVTNNPSVLNPDYMEADDAMCVIQYAGHMEQLDPLFTYNFGGLKVGENFTITFECYYLNPPSTPNNYKDPLGFVACITPNPVDENQPTSLFTYKVSSGDAPQVEARTGATFHLASASSQKKVTVTISGKATARDMALTLRIPSYGAVEGYALGITSIKVEGTIDPIARSSQGKTVCEGEQTVLSLDRNYNASTYSWQRKEGGSWTEIGDKKSVRYEMTKDETFRCLVDGTPTNELELKSIVCCVSADGKPTSRQTLLWETFGRFNDGHTYVDKDGNVSTTPSTWTEYRQNVSYTIPSHGFDNGVDLCSPNCTCNNPNLGIVDDGYYAIVTPTPTGFPCKPEHQYGGFVTWMNGVDADHTSEITGESRGGALAINVDAGYKGVVFEAEFPHICEGKDIFYEVFFANATGGTENSPMLTVKILDAVTGELLDEVADIEAKQGGGWTPLVNDPDIGTQKRFYLAGSSERTIKMQVLSTSGPDDNPDYWKHGNDVIIDDIKFMVCSPPSLEAYSDINTLAKDSTICSETEFTIDAPITDLLENFFGHNEKFLFQYSGDMGQTWTNISGLMDHNEFKINTGDYTSDKMQFRVVVATPDVLDAFLTEPNKADITNACRNYSITEPFTITCAGDLDLGATVKTSACVDAAVPLVAPALPSEVVAWGWANEAGATVVPLSDDNDALSYEISHKSDEKEIYYFIAQTADGCDGKRKYEVDVKPTVDFDYDKVEDCGLTTFRIIDKTPTDAAFVWTYNGDDYPGDEFTYDETMLSPNEEPTTMKYVELLGTATGYCDNADNAYQFILKPIPGEPAVTTPSLSFVMEAGSSASVKAAATAEPDHTLEWVPTLATASSAPVTGWSSDEPFVSLDYDSTYFFFVRQVNEYGCEGPAVNVNVQVSSAKRPYTRDTTVCLNEVVDLNSLAQKTDNIYELNWYDELGNLLPEAPSVPTNVPGVSNFYVTQKSTEIPYPESKVDTVTVEVVGVYTPDTTGNTYHYCSDDQALPLVAKLNKDESQSFYADKVIWSVDGGTEGESVPT